MLAPRLDVRQAAGRRPEHLLGGVVDLDRTHTEAAEQPPDRGVVGLEEVA
jgi:hypothetical protein